MDMDTRVYMYLYELSIKPEIFCLHRQKSRVKLYIYEMDMDTRVYM